MPQLFTLQPPLRVRLQVGDRPNVRTGDAPTAIVDAAFEFEGSAVLDLVALRDRVVREPSVRQLVHAMEVSDAGAALACAHLDNVEGLLLLPLGDRVEPFNGLELQALERLGEALGGALSTALAHRRAESHIEELTLLRRDAEDRALSLEEELEQLRGQFDVLGQRLAEDQTLHVAYSRSMRRVQMRAIEMASRDEPILLVASGGAPVVPIARFVHDRGPRWQRPFVAVDAGVADPDQTTDLLFGSRSDGQSGWFQSALEGTLLVRDVPALPWEAQTRLANALDEPKDGTSAVRLIATSRAPIDQLRSRQGLCPELLEAFGQSEIHVPSLRERREDLPSLVLLTIHRACRVLGVEPVGIESHAMAALVAHDWPADVAELEFVIEVAVARASGKSIQLSDLPPLGVMGGSALG